MTTGTERAGRARPVRPTATTAWRDDRGPRRRDRKRTPRRRRRTRELTGAVRLLRRYAGRRRVLVTALALLVLEAATAVIEPVPIAFLIDFLQGSRPPLRELGFPPLLASAFLETVAVATVALVAIAAVNSAADSLAEICFARLGRTFGYNVRVALYAQLRTLGMAFHDQRRTGRRADPGDRRRHGAGGVRGQVGQRPGRQRARAGRLADRSCWPRSWQVALVAVAVVPVLAAGLQPLLRGGSSEPPSAQRRHEGELASADPGDAHLDPGRADLRPVRMTTTSGSPSRARPPRQAALRGRGHRGPVQLGGRGAGGAGHRRDRVDRAVADRSVGR